VGAPGDPAIDVVPDEGFCEGDSTMPRLRTHSSRSTRSRLLALLLLTGGTLFLPATAGAVVGEPIGSSSGLHTALGCNTTLLCPVGEIFSLGPAVPVTGTLTLTPTTLDFSISLASATLPGNDGAVTGVTFSGVTYSGSFSVTDQGGGRFQVPAQTAAVSGTLTPIGAGSAVPFNLSVQANGICNVGSAPICGLTFGLAGATDFAIDVNGNTRLFSHSVDLFVVPEPGTAMLLGLGLAGLASRRRIA
jgi:hypothetical protein